MADSPVATVIAVLAIAIIAASSITVFDVIAQTGDGDILERKDEAVIFDGGVDRWYAFDSGLGRGTNETVVDSRGFAVRLRGAEDSFVSASSGLSITTDENWTISQGVWINSSATGRNMTVLSVGDPDLVIRYAGNQTQATWQAVWIGTQDTFVAEVNATDPPNATVLMVTRNASNLTIFRNTSANNTVDINATGNFNGNLTEDEPLDGRLDETREFSDILNQSQRDWVVGEPVRPLKNATRASRIMYDAGSGTTLLTFFIGGDGSLSNGTWTDGFAGHTMDRDGLVANGDYRWREEGPEIRPLSSGELDGAPVAYVEYDHEKGEASLIYGFEDAMNLVPIVMLAMLAAVVMAVTQRFRQ